MGDLKSFRKEILLSALCMAGFSELVSLVAYKPSIWFALGLAAGTATGMAGFLILTRTNALEDISKRSGLVVLSYFARMLIYGAVFFLCIRMKLACGFGSLVGFVALPFGILVLYGIVYRFKKKNPLNDWTEPKEWNDLSVYDDEDDDW